MTTSQRVDEQVRKIEGLVARIEQSADPDAQAAAREMVQALLDLHAAGFAKMLEWISQAGDAGRQALDACVEDELVSHLLLLHGLHPEGLASRVSRALDKVRPYLGSHGGDVELLAVSDGVVRLRLRGSCQGCPSSQATLRDTVERAIYETAPDVAAIEVEGLAESPAAAGLVQLGAAAPG